MKGNGYRKVTWDTLQNYPGETNKIYSGPLACSNLAFLIGLQPAGKKGTMHSHDVAEEIYVLLKGNATLLVKDEVIPMKEWDAVRVEPGVMHTTHNNSDQDAYWLAMATPINEFLDFDADAYGPPKDE